MTSIAVDLEHMVHPGAPFELADWSDGERAGKCWRNGPQTLVDIFAATRAHHSKPFLACGSDRITYAEFRAASDRVVGLLGSVGVGQGDVVAISLSHEPEWIAAFFAAARLGAITAAINPAAESDELALLLAMSKAVALVCDERTLGRVHALDRSATRSIQHVLLTRGQNIDRCAHWPVISLDAEVGPVGTWTNLVAAPATGLSSSGTKVAPDDPALILFTSGTIGRPKAVLLSHRCCAYSVFHAAYRNARSAVIAGKPPPPPPQREALLLVLPLFHASGSCDALLPLMIRGGLVATMPFWSPARACRLIAEHEITIVAMVPSIAEQLVRHPDFPQAKGSVRQIICGGAPPSVDLPSMIASHGITPGQNWGMTETGGGVIGQVGAEYLSRPGSCGLPAPILGVRIVDKTGRVLPPNEVGEVEVSGPQVMMGYWGDDELTREIVVDGWLKTGDLGLLDEAGYCSIVDRAKDMIIMAGENIYCSEIENVLRAHPKISDAAVIGAPDEGVGERPVAIVVVKDGMAPPSEMDVRIFAAERLAKSKIPASVICRSQALPRNGMGKLEKTKLRQEILPALRQQ